MGGFCNGNPHHGKISPWDCMGGQLSHELHVMNGSEQAARYHRQVILPQVGTTGQERLRHAKVLIVGLGGLGSPVGLYLAAAGVGTLGLADMDNVDLSNLHRQILHHTGAIGEKKTTSASRALETLNGDCRLVLHEEGIQPRNATGIFAQYDLIVDGSDNFPTRYLVNDAACLTGKPVVYGSIFQFEGQVSVFDPGAGGPCYRCLFPAIPEPGSVPNCAEAGVLGALCGIIGSWQASEALKLILGIGDPLLGKIKVIDTLTGRERLVALKKDPACPLCGDHPTITGIDAAAYQGACETAHPAAGLDPEISVGDAAAALSACPAPLLLDVREDIERAICALPNSLHIPIGQLPQQWKSLPSDQRILVYCHHGMRSLHSVNFLRDRGLLLAQSIAGGIDAWSCHIDPSLARY